MLPGERAPSAESAPVKHINSAGESPSLAHGDEVNVRETQSVPQHQVDEIHRTMKDPKHLNRPCPRHSRSTRQAIPMISGIPFPGLMEGNGEDHDDAFSSPESVYRDDPVTMQAPLPSFSQHLRDRLNGESRASKTPPGNAARHHRARRLTNQSSNLRISSMENIEGNIRDHSSSPTALNNRNRHGNTISKGSEHFNTEQPIDSADEAILAVGPVKTNSGHGYDNHSARPDGGESQSLEDRTIITESRGARGQTRLIAGHAITEDSYHPESFEEPTPVNESYFKSIPPRQLEPSDLLFDNEQAARSSHSLRQSTTFDNGGTIMRVRLERRTGRPHTTRNSHTQHEEEPFVNDMNIMRLRMERRNPAPPAPRIATSFTAPDYGERGPTTRRTFYTHGATDGEEELDCELRRNEINGLLGPAGNEGWRVPSPEAKAPSPTPLYEAPRRYRTYVLNGVRLNAPWAENDWYGDYIGRYDHYNSPPY